MQKQKQTRLMLLSQMREMEFNNYLQSMKLTKEELVLLANLLAQAQVKVLEAPKLIELVNKLTQMTSELDQKDVVPETKN